MIGGDRKLAYYTLINFGGSALPAVVGILAIPPLIDGLGVVRFGVLTLAWMFVGYFSLFDFGLGRAVTQLVAARAGTEREAETPRLVRTALVLMLGFGLIGTGLCLALASVAAHDVLRLPAEHRAETEQAFRVLALALPFVITTTGLRGVLEALNKFPIVNLIRIPLGVFTFLGPLATLAFTPSLVAIAAVLAVGRALAWLAYAIACARAVPGTLRGFGIDRALLRPLLSFGGWMTVSNVVGPVMVYMDRFLIGALISTAAVAYYATPYEVVTRLWLVPTALMAVLFPAFASVVGRDGERTRTLFRRGVGALWVVLFPVALLVVAFAEEMLTLWLGADFAVRSAAVAQWLAAGVLINSVAQVPFTLLQGAQRADLTAKLHLAELVPYLAALWFCTMRFGIVGAAMVWTVRAAVDCAALMLLTAHRVPALTTDVRVCNVASAAAFALLAIAALPESPLVRGAYVVVVLFVFALAVGGFVVRHRRNTSTPGRLTWLRGLG